MFYACVVVVVVTVVVVVVPLLFSVLFFRSCNTFIVMLCSSVDLAFRIHSLDTFSRTEASQAEA